MATAFDVKGFALELLERSKETLRRTKTLAPVGFILRANGAMDITYFDTQSSTDECQQIESFLRTARSSEHLAVVTIHNSECQASELRAGLPSVGSNGECSASSSHEAGSELQKFIIVRIDLPTQKTTILKVPYVLNKSADYTFEPLVETLEDSEVSTSAHAGPGGLSEELER